VGVVAVYDYVNPWAPASGALCAGADFFVVYDDVVGDVADALKARGMWDNTVLLVWSDNGGPIYTNGSAGANNYPLRGGKVSNWEGGVRSNALVSGGFIGTLVIIRPGGEAFTPAMLLPLAQVVTNCGFQVLTIRLARTENTLTMNFYTGWVGALAATPLLLLAWDPQVPVGLWGLMVVMGVAGAMGHFLLILAYRRAPASTLTPYLYAQIGFAMGCGWVVFGHVPDGWSILGMGLIALCGAAGAWLTLVEHRQTLRSD
jgi:uncharacterized membrane protein